MGKSATAKEILAQAARLHRSGQLAQAITLYEKAVRKMPRNAAALNLLGLAYFQSGRAQEAAASLQQALAYDPDLPQAHYNLGMMLQVLNRHDDAVRHYRHALAAAPGDPEIHNNLGTALKALQHYGAAIEHFGRALVLRPDYAEARLNWGNVLDALGRREEAVGQYEKAIALKPGLAEAHMNLGSALKELGRLDEAASYCERAVSLKPDNPAAHYNLANVYNELALHDQAIRHYDRALALKPDDPAAHYNLANVYSAVALHDQAIQPYDRALALKPDYAEAKYNKGLMYLSLGRLGEGWPLYEARVQADPNFRPRGYPQPQWKGERIEGALLVWGEQGLGDQIIHSSLVPELKAYATSVILEVDPRLVPLLARSFPDVEVAGLGPGLHPGPVDAQAPLASIGRYLRTDLASFPRHENGFLRADPARAAILRQRLRADHTAVIGLSWRSANAKVGSFKTAQLQDFSSLLRLPHCRFIDLQYGDTRAERQAVESELGVKVERLEDIDNTQDIDGLAALITACDLVVSVSNTNAHLAGALGRPTWVLVPFSKGRFWYWFYHRSDSPFYARARVRRQQKGQSWEGLARSVSEEVLAFLKSVA